MVIRAQPHAEPIPGYRLLERLGGGGLGEVWKAEAPGGILKAIRFVHGKRSENGLAHRGLEALDRVKTVRHPYILSLERYDIIDGQLLIVMELAERHLQDRFQECVAGGQVGIPRDELLRYLGEVAEALDLMNLDYQLQHLDIKPQNLFLIHNHVKVADFGLVKELEGMNTRMSRDTLPLYTAPETLEGTVSRQGDQYSLAIVYQELLTGQRPFDGGTVRQLIMQHLSGAPNLASLPEGDRGPIGRALSKKPGDRFSTCTELVRALRQPGGPTVETPPAIVRPGPTRHGERPPLPPPITLPPVLAPSATVSKNALPTPAAEPKPVAPSRPEITGDGVLFPALIIGLGGFGLSVLQQLRKRLHDRCGPPDLLPQLRLLAIDTDPEAARDLAADGLTETEVLIARLNKPTHYLKTVRNRAILDTWLNLATVCRLPRNQVTTEGLRILGRLGLVDNYRAVAGRLRADLEACVEAKALGSAERQTRLGIRTNQPRVYIVTGLGGGTGGGMFLDVAYIVREQLRRLGYPRPDVVSLLLLPAADAAAKKSPALANTFAALTELHHFSATENRYQAFFDDSEEPIHDAGPPFARCVVMPLPPANSDATGDRSVAALAGDFLCRELITPLGRTAAQIRAAANEPDEVVCETFGAHCFAMPRRALREQVANQLGMKLVRSWVSSDQASMQSAMASRLADPSTGIDLKPETLAARLQAAAERNAPGTLETPLQTILHGPLGPDGDLEPMAILGALGQMERLVGRPATDAEPPFLGKALAEAAESVRREYEQRTNEFLTRLVEEPRFRVSGAEEASRQITAAIRNIGQAQQSLYHSLLARAADAHAHIHALARNLQKGTWWPGRKAKIAVELRRALEEYPRTRYQGLLREHLLALYRGLLEDLARRQQELTLIGKRLEQFQRLLQEDLTLPSGTKPDLGPGRHFFPAGCRGFDETIDALTRSLPPETLLEMDRKVQPAIRRQFRSLWQLCLGPGEAFKDLWTVLEQQASGVAEGLLGPESAAVLYRKEQPTQTAVRADLATAFEEAAPPLGGRRPLAPEIRLLIVPADPAGEELARLAKNAIGDVEALTAPGADDVFFYREQSRLPLADLPQLGLLAEEAYRHLASTGAFTPHTRMDVPRWLPVV